MGMPLVDRLAAVGFPAAQAELLAELMGRFDGYKVAKVGVADAEDEEGAIKVANATKARLNELLEKLK